MTYSVFRIIATKKRVCYATSFSELETVLRSFVDILEQAELTVKLEEAKLLYVNNIQQTI